MMWLGLLGLIWLQAGCAAREARCDSSLRPINTSSNATPNAAAQLARAPQ
jgi:hypothetical protein